MFLDQTFEDEGLVAGRYQVALAARRAAEPAIVRFLRGCRSELQNACPALFERLCLFRKDVAPRIRRDADWCELMDTEWATMTVDERLFCWFDYLDDVRREQASVNDHGHILQPYFNSMVATPVLGQAMMHHRGFMGWLLADN